MHSSLARSAVWTRVPRQDAYYQSFGVLDQSGVQMGTIAVQIVTDNLWSNKMVEIEVVGGLLSFRYVGVVDMHSNSNIVQS